MTNNDGPHVALPKLYGAPAYARPKPQVEGTDRPFDPDDLPLEAERTEDEARLVRELAARPYAGPDAAPVSGVIPAADPHLEAPSLRPRPFRLRAITERLRPPGAGQR